MGNWYKQDLYLSHATHRIRVSGLIANMTDNKIFSISAENMTIEELFNVIKQYIEVDAKEILGANIIFQGNPTTKSSHIISITEVKTKKSRAFCICYPYVKTIEVAIMLSEYLCGGKCDFKTKQ